MGFLIRSRLPGSEDSFTPPLDEASATAVAAWGLRKLRSAYSGSAIVLCKSGDTTGIDVGFTAAGHFDEATAEAYLGGTAGGLIKRLYDHSGNGHDFVQTTTARQPSLVFGGSSPAGRAVVRGFEGSLMTVADNAAYKTNNIHFIGAFSSPPNTPGINTQRHYFIGYPTATNSGNEANRWAITNSGGPWQFLPQLNGDVNENLEGIGAAYRRLLYPYSYSTQSRILRAGPNNVTWGDRTGATITYPNAVGLHLFNSPALDGTGSDTGNGADDGGIDFAEGMLFTSTQAAEATMMTNISDYHEIVDPPSSFSSDSYTWTPRYYGGYGTDFAQFEQETLAGGDWYRQGALDTYSMARAASGSNASNLMRFEVRQYDNWDASNRSEIFHEPFEFGKTFQLSWAIMIPVGTSTPTSSWDDHGQCHTGEGGGAGAATIFLFRLLNDAWRIDRNGQNGESGAATVYTDPGTITKGSYDDFFVECLCRNDGGTESLKIWRNSAQIVNVSGTTLFSNRGSNPPYMKFGIYRDPAITIVGRALYANIEISTDKAVTDLTARIASPLTHPTP